MRKGEGSGEGERKKNDVFPFQHFFPFSFPFILYNFQLCLHGSQLVDLHMCELRMHVYMLMCVCVHACTCGSQRLMLDAFLKHSTP